MKEWIIAITCVCICCGICGFSTFAFIRDFPDTDSGGCWGYTQGRHYIFAKPYHDLSRLAREEIKRRGGEIEIDDAWSFSGWILTKDTKCAGNRIRIKKDRYCEIVKAGPDRPSFAFEQFERVVNKPGHVGIDVWIDDANPEPGFRFLDRYPPNPIDKD